MPWSTEIKCSPMGKRNQYIDYNKNIHKGVQSLEHLSTKCRQVCTSKGFYITSKELFNSGHTGQSQMRLESAPLESLPQWGKHTFLRVLEPLSQNAILVTLHHSEKVSEGQQVSRTLVSFHFSGGTGERTQPECKEGVHPAAFATPS